MNVRTILCPLPDEGFDPTETAVPWRVLTDAGHRVVFATERGATPATDPLLVDPSAGMGRLLFSQLAARQRARDLYAELARTPAFRAPVAWSEVDPAEFDGLLLPGGHAQGMRQLIESPTVQRLTVEMFRRDAPVGAICHGVLLPARAVDPETDRSVLDGRATTCLPRWMERLAWWSTAWKLGRYYRTYPEYVQDEVLAADAAFQRGPLGLRRGTETDARGTFVVTDGNYVSARWPGDAWAFAHALAARLADCNAVPLTPAAADGENLGHEADADRGMGGAGGARRRLAGVR